VSEKKMQSDIRGFSLIILPMFSVPPLLGDKKQAF
jgi:hypothetical protein